jgi:hypothetical protein
MWNFIPAPHRLSPIRDSIHSRNPTRTCGGANRRVIKAIKVAKTLLGQLINRRSLGVFSTITADPRNPIVLAGNPEDVGLLRCLGHAQNRAQKKEADRNSLSQIHRGFIRIAIPKSIKAIGHLFYSSRNRKIEKINGIRKQPKSDKTPSNL